MKEIVLLELFSGIGGFAKGLSDAGYVIKKHYFSEVDKHAIANYKFNFKNSEYIGSVTNVRHIIRTIGKFLQDNPGSKLVITFGSPCQDFSLAGKGKGLNGTKSSLIKFAIFLVKWLRPDFYIWENVKGAYSTNNGADFWAIIKAFANLRGYRHEQQLLNTAWFIPQNRERIYSIGHLAGRSESRVFPFRECDKWNNETRAERSFWSENTQIAATLKQRDWKGGTNFISVKSNTKSGFDIAEPGDSINFSVHTSKTRRGRVGKGVAQTLDTQCNQGVIQINENKNSGGKQPYQQDMVYDSKGIAPAMLKDKSDIIIAQRGRYNSEGKTEQQFESRNDGNTNTLTGVNKDNLVNGIRRLTEIECERLQGFEDDWTKYGDYNGVIKEIPKNQRYKMCGNAVTVEVVRQIGLRLLNN